MNDITAFVPRLAAELGRRQGSHWTSVDGSMLSADISGFTALSEKLAGKGKAGAEEITELINTCFTALIDAAYDYGGEVIKFGGDALLVLFRGDDHQRRVANASLAMQIALHSSPAAKRANLTMTVGASHGPFDVFVAGSGYRELLIIGPAASNVIHLEGEADKGETLVSPEIAAFVPPERVGRSHAGGLAIGGDPFDEGLGPDVRKEQVDGLDAFVPPQVLEQLAAFADLGGEHRIVSVGFVMVTGVAAQLDAVGPDGTADALGRLVDDLIAATGPYGVTALHTDIAGDGLKFVLCAGAPVNPGDTSDALLQAALDIAAIDSPFVLRQGAQTGRVFAGFLGSPYRRTYTLMGDPVNTAARMLGKAGDRDIVAVGTMVDDTRAVFESQELEPFLVKGKTEPIVAHKIRGVTGDVRRGASSTRFIGRRRELEAVSSVIGELGGILDIVGPAGVGKSRLLDAALDEAEGLLAFHGGCTPYGTASPYSVFRRLLRGGIGIDVNADPAEAGELLEKFVSDRAPELMSRLPLLAVPFGAEVASTPEVDAIDPEFRRARLHETVVDFYDTTLAGRPVFLAIEDLHWVDDASAELVAHLIRAAASRPWAGVLTRRPGGWAPEPDLPHVTTLALEPLGPAEVRDLAVAASSRALSDTELELVTTRAEGNPMFAIELARAVSTSPGQVDLPDSVEQVIAARIDALEPSTRRFVRVASVFGPTFQRDEVEAVLAQQPDELAFAHRGAADIIERSGNGTWQFTHALYRDVAYEGLPYRRRQRLHGTVAETLESRAQNPVDIAPLLSLHYSEARNHLAAWRFSVIAGRSAYRQHAHREAEVALTRALRASRSLRDLDPSERVEVSALLGEIRTTLGDFGGSREALQLARRLNDDPALEVDLMRRLGTVAEREGQLSSALAWYSRAEVKIPVECDDLALLGARSKLLLAKAGILHRRGDQHGCARLSHSALADAEQAEDDRSRAQALERLHVAHVYLRSRYADVYGQSARAAYEELGDWNAQVSVLNNLGIQSYFAGDWSAASSYYAEAAAAGEAAGNVVFGGSAALNSGEILSDQGRWPEAISMYDDARRNWEAVGYATGVAAAELFQGVALTRTLALDEARDLIESASAKLRDLTIAELIDDAESRLLELDACAGDPTVVERGRAVLERLGADHPLEGRILRAMAVGAASAATPERSRELLDQSLRACPEGGHERAMTLHTLLELDSDAPEVGAWRAELDTICERLDIVRLPAVLAP